MSNINMEVAEELYIIQRVLAGDSAAFEKIVLKYHRLIFTIAVRMTKNREEAEEITQDVFVKAYRSLHTYRKQSKLSTWLYKIAFFTSINHLRSAKHKIETIEWNMTYDQQDLVSTQQDGLEYEQQMIRMALFSLPENDRIVLTLYYFEEVSVKEIAEITGWAVSNIKVRLHRARQKMHDVLTANQTTTKVNE